MDILDQIGGVTFCTSTTRPGTPYPGMQIFETDTQVQYTWNGTIWSRMSAGIVGGKRYGSGSAAVITTLPNSTAETLTGMDTGDVFLQGDRYYRISTKVEWDSTTGTSGVYEFRIRANDLAGQVWSQTLGLAAPTLSLRYTTFLDAVIKTGSTDGNRKFVLTMKRSSATTGPLGRIWKDGSTWPWMLIEFLGSGVALTDV
jgi:hypothetical protein